MPKEKKAIRAVLINPHMRTIEDIEVIPDFQHYYGLMDTDIIQPINPSSTPRHTLFLDEEGKLKPNHYFSIRGYPDILAGNAILVKGQRKDSDFTAEQIKTLIRWG